MAYKLENQGNYILATFTSCSLKFQIMLKGNNDEYSIQENIRALQSFRENIRQKMLNDVVSKVPSRYYSELMDDISIVGNKMMSMEQYNYGGLRQSNYDSQAWISGQGFINHGAYSAAKASKPLEVKKEEDNLILLLL